MKSLYTCKAASVLAEEVPLRGNETARPIEAKKIKLLVNKCVSWIIGMSAST
jgi:hypothetical protein